MPQIPARHDQRPPKKLWVAFPCPNGTFWVPSRLGDAQIPIAQARIARTVAACTRPMPAFVWRVCSPRLGRSGTRCQRGILPGLLLGIPLSAPPRDPPRSVPPVRAAALAPRVGRRRPSPASAIPAALARAARLDGPARPRATRGPVARGRAGRHRRLRVRGPTASAILDAAAAAVSASSCVFAARCRFARPRRQRGHTRARGRKRKEEKGVESAGDRSLSTEVAAERGGEAAKAPAPAPPPPPTRPGGLRPVRCARPAAMPGPRRR